MRQKNDMLKKSLYVQYLLTEVKTYCEPLFTTTIATITAISYITIALLYI